MCMCVVHYAVINDNIIIDALNLISNKMSGNLFMFSS